MDVSSFFEYPNLALSESAGDLVFLADLSEENWRKLLARTDVRRFRAGEEVIRAGDTDAEHRYRRLLIGTDGSIAGAILLGYPNDTAATRPLEHQSLLRTTLSDRPVGRCRPAGPRPAAG